MFLKTLRLMLKSVMFSHSQTGVLLQPQEYINLTFDHFYCRFDSSFPQATFFKEMTCHVIHIHLSPVFSEILMFVAASLSF